MEKIKKLESNSTYMIITRSTAKSCFFDNPKQIKLFENLCETFLGKMCKIRKVLCVNKGYVMIMETQSSETIKEAYITQRKRSKKVGEGAGVDEIWRMISEHFRFMGCSFVKICNSRTGCEGTKFCRNYERYSLNEEEVEWVMRFLDLGKILLDQKVDRYKLNTEIKQWYRIISNEVSDKKLNGGMIGSFGYGGEDYLRI